MQALPCPKGTFKNGINKATSCSPCPTGLTTSGPASIIRSACNLASPGYMPVVVNNTVVAVQPCPIGSYGPDGIQVCLEVMAQRYSQARSLKGLHGTLCLLQFAAVVITVSHAYYHNQHRVLLNVNLTCTIAEPLILSVALCLACGCLAPVHQLHRGLDHAGCGQHITIRLHSTPRLGLLP